MGDTAAEAGGGGEGGGRGRRASVDTHYRPADTTQNYIIDLKLSTAAQREYRAEAAPAM